MSSNQAILWKIPEVRLPSWFQKYDWEANLEVRSATLFKREIDEFSQTKVENIELTISSAERAILEYLRDVPKDESIDEANYIMEGLSSLRPSVLQTMLEACESVKVKRLFLCMAEHHNHAWLERLELSSIDLGGAGKEILLKAEN